MMSVPTGATCNTACAPDPARASRPACGPVSRLIGMACWMLASVCPPAHAQSSSTAYPDGPPARGFIVKLKSTGTASLASATTHTGSLPDRESAQAIRSRLSAIAARSRVSYLDSHPTGLARSHVLNYQRWISAAEAQETVQRLRQDADVEWVVVNSMERPMTVTVAPTDPLYVQTTPQPVTSGGTVYGGQWWLKSRTNSQRWSPGSAPSNQPGAPGISDAWNTLANYIANAGVLSTATVAVVDSGVVFSHPDLAGRFLPGYDFVSEVDYANDGNGQDSDPSDPGTGLTQAEINANPALFSKCGASTSSWHGTLIAGELGALTNNNLGNNSLDGAGMLWQLPSPTSDARLILPVRVAGNCGAAVSDIIEGMLWASGVNYSGTPATNPYPARVVTLSYGGDGACNSAYQEAVDAMARAGAILVAAAGNNDASGGFGATSPTRPANCLRVLAVTALQRDGSKAAYANQVIHNPSIGRYGLATVGGNETVESILSTSNAGSYGPGNSIYSYGSGTSFATPIAAGVAAMVLSINPRISPQQLLDAMTTVGQGVGQDSTTAHATVNGLPSCSSTTAVGNCNCTADTCGAGTLNALSAVNWAVGTANDFTHYTYVPPPAGTVSSSFVPESGGPTATESGRGGGAVGAWWLASLAGAAAALARQRRRHAQPRC